MVLSECLASSYASGQDAAFLIGGQASSLKLLPPQKILSLIVRRRLLGFAQMDSFAEVADFELVMAVPQIDF